MKKTFCIFLVAALWASCAFSVSAQSVRFGLKAGAGVAKFDYEPDTVVSPIDYGDFLGPRNTANGVYRPTFIIGGLLEYDLSKDFVLSSGLQAALKYAQHTVPYAYSRDPNKYRYHVLYLQLPLTLHYRWGNFFAGAGGYAGLAIAGKWKDDIQDDSPAYHYLSGKLKFGNDPVESNLQRFDYGVRGELGYGFKQFRLSIAFDQGIAKLRSSNGLQELPGYFSDVEKGVVRNQALYATIAYYWLAK